MVRHCSPSSGAARRVVGIAGALVAVLVERDARACVPRQVDLADCCACAGYESGWSGRSRGGRGVLHAGANADDAGAHGAQLDKECVAGGASCYLELRRCTRAAGNIGPILVPNVVSRCARAAFESVLELVDLCRGSHRVPSERD